MSLTQQIIKKATEVLRSFGKKATNTEFIGMIAAGHYINVTLKAIDRATGIERKTEKSWPVIGYIYDESGGKHSVIKDPETNDQYFVDETGKLHKA